MTKWKDDDNVIDFSEYKNSKDSSFEETEIYEDEPFEDTENDIDEAEEIPDKQTQILSFDKKSDNRNDRVNKVIGSAILLVGIVLIFAAAIYARHRMNTADHNNDNKVSLENTPMATGSNAENAKKDYSWWYDRDMTSSAQMATDPDAQKTIEIGTRLFLGSYKQGPEGESEDIAWLVLEVDDDRVMVVSEYILDSMPYSTNKACQWENSTIRAWLSGDFYNSAFSEQDKEAILTLEIENEDNPTYNTNAGHDTDDAVFLLSIEDINDYFGDVDRKSHATPYVLEKGIASGENTYATYWLRSPGSADIIGSKPGYAANVDFTGEIKYNGSDVTVTTIGIRPAMWLSFETLQG